MSDWDKLRDEMAKLIEKAYKENPKLIQVINAWYKVRVIGDKLQDKTRKLGRQR